MGAVKQTKFVPHWERFEPIAYEVNWPIVSNLGITITDESGTFRIAALNPGPYRLEVSLQGFRTYAQTGIVLQVAATPTINVSLRRSSGSAAPLPNWRAALWHRRSSSKTVARRGAAPASGSALALPRHRGSISCVTKASVRSMSGRR